MQPCGQCFYRRFSIVFLCCKKFWIVFFELTWLSSVTSDTFIGPAAFFWGCLSYWCYTILPVPWGFFDFAEGLAGAPPAFSSSAQKVVSSSTSLNRFKVQLESFQLLHDSCLQCSSNWLPVITPLVRITKPLLSFQLFQISVITTNELLS